MTNVILAVAIMCQGKVHEDSIFCNQYILDCYVKENKTHIIFFENQEAQALNKCLDKYRQFLGILKQAEESD